MDDCVMDESERVGALCAHQGSGGKLVREWSLLLLEGSVLGVLKFQESAEVVWWVSGAETAVMDAMGRSLARRGCDMGPRLLRYGAEAAAPDRALREKLAASSHAVARVRAAVGAL